MSSRNRKRKNRKPRHSSVSELQVTRFEEKSHEVRRHLIQGNARKAYDLLRHLESREQYLVDHTLLKYCACSRRAVELVGMGLTTEAEGFRKKADGQMERIEIGSLSSDDRRLLLDNMDIHEALHQYERLMAGTEDRQVVERGMAYRLVLENALGAVLSYKGEHPLKSDASLISGAMKAMMEGDWQLAGKQMQGISRHSPFAPWRIFCKIMVCHEQNDQVGLARVLKRLPDDFPLSATIHELKRTVGMAEGNSGSLLSRELGTLSVDVKPLLRELGEVAVDGKPHQIVRIIKQLSDMLYPDDPQYARVELLTLLPALDHELKFVVSESLPRIADRLLPEDQVNRLINHCYLMYSMDRPLEWIISQIRLYMENLHHVFSTRAECRLARGYILEQMALAAFKNSYLIGTMYYEQYEEFQKLLGSWLDLEPEEVDEELPIALMEASLGQDPLNREGYLTLLKMLDRKDARKAEFLEVLDRMTDNFPEDPEPWVRKARLHFKSNAYRKAETCLKEAEKRAPWDENLKDLNAISRLRAADSGRSGGYLSKAHQDLAIAIQLDRPGLRDVVSAKEIMLMMTEMVTAYETSDEFAMSDMISDELTDLSPFETWRTLSLLNHDLENGKSVQGILLLMDAVSTMMENHEDRIHDMTSQDVLAVIRPLSNDVSMLYGYNDRVGCAVREYWIPLLARLESGMVFEAYLILMDDGGKAEIDVDIKNRLKKSRYFEYRVDLQFFEAALDAFEAWSPKGNKFRKLVAGLDDKTSKRLKMLSAQLSRYAYNRSLRNALEDFDFSML